MKQVHLKGVQRSLQIWKTSPVFSFSNTHAYTLEHSLGEIPAQVAESTHISALHKEEILQVNVCATKWHMSYGCSVSLWAGKYSFSVSCTIVIAQ